MKTAFMLIITLFYTLVPHQLLAQNPLGSLREYSIEREATRDFDQRTTEAGWRAAEASVGSTYNVNGRSSEEEFRNLILIIIAIWLLFWIGKRSGKE
jgi:hypothetical protein